MERKHTYYCMDVELEFIDDLLGSWPANPYLAEDYIASKAPDAETRAEEVANLGQDAVVEKTKTIFPRDSNGAPSLMAHQIKGFFKEACRALSINKEYRSSKLRAYKKEVADRIFVYPKYIPLERVENVYDFQRPLRAQTPMGERIALANSETASSGVVVHFTVKTIVEDGLEYAREWLDYGELKGLGQWRNAGYGRFLWKELATYREEK